MQNDERAIRQLVETWLEATEAGDSERLLELLADDVVFLTPGRKPFGKEAFAASSKERRNVRVQGVSDIEEIEVLGSWAWMRTRLEVTMTPLKGKPSRRSGYTLTILRKEPNGAWVIARDANLLTEEAARPS